MLYCIDYGLPYEPGLPLWQEGKDPNVACSNVGSVFVCAFRVTLFEVMTSKTGTRSTRSKACNRFEEPWFSTPRWEWNAQDCPPGGTELKTVTDFTCSAFCWNVFLSIGQAASRTIPGQLCCMKSCFGASMFFIPDDSWPCLMWGQSSIFQRHCSWHWFGLLPKQIRKIEKMMEDVLLCSVSFYSSNMATRCHKNSMWFLILQ